jgi:tetratricopeptide (TPR) repeat protein
VGDFMNQADLKQLEEQINQAHHENGIQALITQYNEENNYEALEKVYLSVLDRDSEDLKALYNLATIYADYMGEYEKAADLYEQILTIDPNEPFVHFNYGTILEFQFSDYKNAIIHYEEAFRVNKYYVDAYLNLSWLYLERLKNTERAVETIKLGLQHNQSWELNAHLAYIDFNYLTNYEEAMMHCERALELSPKNSLVLTYQGQIQVKLKNFDKAYEYFKRAYATHHLNPILVFEFGQLLITYYKDFDQTKELLLEATEYFKDNAIYPSFLASLYLNTGHLDEARTYLRVAEEKPLKNQDAMLIIGYLKAMIDQDTEDAMMYFEKVVEMNPNNLSALSIVGFYSLFNSQQIDLALDYFNRIIDLGAKFYPAYFIAAQIYAEYYQDYHKALDVYQKIDASALEPVERAHLYVIMGQLHQTGLKDAKRALDYYEKAYELSPSNQLEELMNLLYDQDKTLVN